ncbi:hypothetical protein ACJ72_01576 [Emergomyces africanus]|uniref:F-box domain-containing protein n=1 Tax=Emergomyces africanus TaxID=1955775 RepID=A0A1B7P4S2_9EURO|nr:hypothetical protein ACJ72_01576 [Emergomyces africanus]
MATLMPGGYRSATEFRFDREQADAIIRTTVYHYKDYCLSVIWYSRREHNEIRPSISTPFQRTLEGGLGSLDQLPLELLFDTLYCLDMYSLFKFRQVNPRSRQMVDSLNQYCRESPETQVRTLASIRKQLQMTKAELAKLRSFKSLPGIYSMNESVQNSSITIISLHHATLVCRQQSHALPHVQPGDRNQKFNFMGSCALPYYDKQTGSVEHGVSCAGCQLAIEKDIIGTRGTKWGYDARDKVYAQDGFLGHFRWCEQAQLL